MDLLTCTTTMSANKKAAKISQKKAEEAEEETISSQLG